jgi:ABC-type multidrug transport system ATPase subunit/pSer/pThr/pTyr-binding forkhead associated (FHA) protein/ABC-type multidrug transport system permease subunit
VRRVAVSAEAPGSGWEIEIGGVRLPVTDRAIVLGRDPECDVPLTDDRVSWRHVRVEMSNGSPLITDLGSSNGTFLNGAKMDLESALVNRETIVLIGGLRARIREIDAEPTTGYGGFRRVAIRQRTVRIGRAGDNDIVLDEPNVSWHHAEVRPGEPPVLVDLGSRNGVRMGNQLLQGSSALPPGVPSGIGPFSIRYEGGELIVIDERAGVNLSAQQVTVRIGDRTILHPTSLSVAPGEFAALIGPSGSGKTTLLKCLAGVGQPTGGRVVMGADPLELRLTEVGYVPQSDVVHARLTVREALRYAALLRLPSDTRSEELVATIDDALGELRLSDQADTAVGSLSGGQRKRVACGIELIGKPTMLLLDEPTSGLDPALERQLMLMLRRLANTGRGVVVVTHATSSLSLCDTVAVMGQDGHMLFAGAPREGLEHFQVPAYDEIYNAIDLVDVPDSRAGVAIAPLPRTRARFLSGGSLVKQATTLTSRYARTMWRDRRTLMILIAQAPVMALLIGLLYPAHLLAIPDRQPTRSAQFLFLLVTAALWLGLIDSCREIVKERSIIARELAVGVRIDAYLIAKSTLLFLLTTVQCILLVAVATLIQPLHESTGAYLMLIGLLIVTSWSTVSLGLLVSTLARTVDQATSLIPLLLIPQLLFGGALVPLARMAAPIRLLADLMVSRWAFAGAGHVIDMNARLAASPKLSILSGYGTSFFSLSPAVAAIVVLGFSAMMLLAAAVLLARSRTRAQ